MEQAIGQALYYLTLLAFAGIVVYGIWYWLKSIVVMNDDHMTDHPCCKPDPAQCCMGAQKGEGPSMYPWTEPAEEPKRLDLDKVDAKPGKAKSARDLYSSDAQPAVVESLYKQPKRSAAGAVYEQPTPPADAQEQPKKGRRRRRTK